MDTVDSAKNLDHYEVCQEMLAQFANNCDYRQAKLKKRAVCSLFRLSFSQWREYKSYKVTTMFQIENLVNVYKLWNDQYTIWMQEQQDKKSEEEAAERKKITIKGFSGCFDITKKKRGSKKKGS
jgi:hypothetical protein